MAAAYGGAPAYAPPPSIALPAGQGVMQNNVFNITQQPGEDGGALAKRIKSEIDTHWRDKMSEAKAGR